MGAGAKAFYHDDAVVFAGMFRAVKKAGKNSSVFRAIAWVLSWILSTDHKRVGILYFVAMFSFFCGCRKFRYHDEAGAISVRSAVF